MSEPTEQPARKNSPLSAASGQSREVVLLAPAKVNLHLEVIRKRPDGFHEIETILQAVQLFDTVAVRLMQVQRGGTPRIELNVSPPGTAPLDDTNLCWRAARLFCDRQRVSGKLAIQLHKEIPAGAGLGGGSSDAVAVLMACNELFGANLEKGQLAELAAELGSDCPFFVQGGTALARGRGTELTALPAIRSGRFLIVKPDMELDTSEVYSTLKMGLTVRSPKANINEVKSLIARFPTSSWFGFNRLEEVVLPSQPMLQRLIFRLRDFAPLAMLTGSGAAAVAVFAEDNLSPDFIDEFARTCSFVRVVGPHAAGVEFREG